MAEDNKTAEGMKSAIAALKAEQEVTDLVQAGSTSVNNEARESDAEANEAPGEPAPYPSQEDADAIKAAASTGANPYLTRDMKA